MAIREKPALLLLIIFILAAFTLSAVLGSKPAQAAALDDIVVEAGKMVEPIVFTFGGADAAYNWTNDTAAIGLAESGSSDINAFRAENATAGVLVATITVTDGTNTERFQIHVIPNLAVTATTVIRNGEVKVSSGFPAKLMLNNGDELAFILDTAGASGTFAYKSGSKIGLAETIPFWSKQTTITSNAVNSSSKAMKAIYTLTINLTYLEQQYQHTATIEITVNPPEITGISLDTDQIRLRVGESRQITAVLTPADIANASIKWTSIDPYIAAVDQNGVITAVTAGQTFIEAKSRDGDHSALVAVTIEDIVTGISLFPSSAAMKVGAILQLTSTILPLDTPSEANGVRWQSSDNSIATVDGNGIITAKGEGSVIITVTSNYGGHQASCTITVTKTTKPPRTADNIILFPLLFIFAAAALGSVYFGLMRRTAHKK